MKLFLASLVTVFALAVSAQADVTAKIEKVHLCCDSCVKGVNKAIEGVSGVTADSDKDAMTVILKGPDKATVQKAADALIEAGYWGESSDVKIESMTGAKDKKVQTAKITGVHLCCPKCVKAVDKITKGVSGVASEDATKGAKSFTVTGDFNEKELMDALQKGGLTGKIE